VLSEQYGIEPRGYLDLDTMLDHEKLEALVILSPAEYHAGHLDAALRAGLHVLCEKPFVWGETDLANRSREIVDAFEHRGCILWENCQWPYTLSAFEALYPGARDAPPRHFEMELQPASRGVESLADAMPHPLSLLQALAPSPAARLEDVWFSTRDSESAELTVRFRYCGETGAIDATTQLTQSESYPRRAAISLDGRLARRVVAPEDYQLSYADTANRSVRMADPLTELIADFVAALEAARSGGIQTRGPEIKQRMRLLAEIVAAYADEENR
jgi:predicted dehydrogenase